MKDIKRFKKRTLIIAAALLLVCIAALLGWQYLAHMLDSQQAAERWQGGSEQEFAQVSCFMAVDDKLSLDEVYTFRNEIQTKLHEAALDIDNDAKLFNDAWSATGEVSVSSDLGKGTVSVTAVGGSFFDFHPLRLLSGSYITADDFTQDRVLLDEDTAWLLFGGTELQGLSFKIEGVPFVVAGVIQREDDAVSKKAYSSGMGIYMSYDAYMALTASDAESADDPDSFSYTAASTSEAGISCYELVLAEPVKSFTYSFVSEKFPIGGGVIVNNSTRYGAFQLLKLAGQFGLRSMQTQGVPFAVAGVIQREDDAVSKKAYSSGMGIYMSYDAYMALTASDEESADDSDSFSYTAASTSEAGISCYELVLAEPVKSFTYSFVSEKFPIGGGVIVNNSTRYGAFQLLKLAGQFGLRSMQTQGVIYPYWENAARCTEDWGMALLLLAVLSGIMPALIAAITLVRCAIALWRSFRDGLWPRAVEKTSEAIRVRQRRHWEKTHPGWDE